MTRISDDEYARQQTQHDPLAIPEVPNAFFIKVKVDHEGVFRPKHGSYVYTSVMQVLRSHQAVYDSVISELNPYLTGEPISRISTDKENEIDPYWNNHMFVGNDARVLYAMVAQRQPKQVIEVGSGNSTRFIRRAISDYDLSTQLISIDPVPRAEIHGISDKVLLESVFDVSLDLFSSLEAGDILFWDGSHIVFNGTDTTHLYLNILPILKKGVLVHIHDIQIPHEYEQGYSAHYYNEQYMLATLVLFSSIWLPILPLSYIGHYYDAALMGRSFWMENQSSPV